MFRTFFLLAMLGLFFGICTGFAQSEGGWRVPLNSP